MIVLFTATLIDSELFLLSSKHIDFFGHFIGRARVRAGAGGQIHARCEHYSLPSLDLLCFLKKKHFACKK